MSVGVSTMKRRIAVGLACCVLVVGGLGSWIFSEIRWSRINNPEGKFSAVSGYLAAGRLPTRVTKVRKDGATYFIAYSPMDTWLALPSGPAAYVFDETGKMINWSCDAGDDPNFEKNWPLPQERSSIEELRGTEPQQTDPCD